MHKPNKQNMHLRLQTSSTQTINQYQSFWDFNSHSPLDVERRRLPGSVLAYILGGWLHIHEGIFVATNTGMMSAARDSHLNQIYHNHIDIYENYNMLVDFLNI